MSDLSTDILHHLERLDQLAGAPWSAKHEKWIAAALELLLRAEPQRQKREAV